MKKICPLVLLILAAVSGVRCSSGGGNHLVEASATTDVQPWLFSLSREGISPTGELSVLVSGDWTLTSTELCAGTKGTLTQSELDLVRGYISDSDLAKLTNTCSERAYTLQVPRDSSTLNTCWEEADSTSEGIKGLVQFFDERVSALPRDRATKDCPDQGPPQLEYPPSAPDPSNAPLPQR